MSEQEFEAPDDSQAEVVDAPEAPETAEAPWSPPREEWEQIASFVNQLGQALDEAPAYQDQQQQFQQPQQPALDPFADDFQSRLDERINQQAALIAQQYVAPMMPFANTVAEQQGRSLMDNEFTTLANEYPILKDPDVGTEARQAAEYVAHGFLGSTNGDPGAALRMGAQYVANLVKSAEDRGMERYKSSLGGNQQRQEPGVNGGGLAAPLSHDLSYEEIALRMVEESGMTGGNDR